MDTDEALETGYGDGTPPGDNLCNDFAAGMAESFRALASARGDRVADDPDVLMTDAASASLFGNVVVLRRPFDNGEWPVLAERLHNFFSGHDGNGFMVFSAWPTPDLRPRGFGRIGHPPLMFRLVQPLVDQPVAGLEIRAVNDADGAHDWERAFVRGYPIPELDPLEAGSVLPAEALAAPRWRHWVGYLDGSPIATASAAVGDRHVEVEFIATIPEARGRGIGRAMTALATLAAPDRPAMLIASDPGRSVYEGLGYVALLRVTLWAGHRR
jgi:GNAT superfamily N-acetyltransferase